MKKYKIIKDGRIMALKAFGDVNKGDIGGFVDTEENLSHEGMCWVYGSARVSDFARVSGSAQVSDFAQVYGSARVSDFAQVSGSARVCGSAQVSDFARVSGSAQVYSSAQVYDSARVYDFAQVSGSAQVYSSAQVSGSARVSGFAQVYGSAVIRFANNKLNIIDDMFLDMKKLIYCSLGIVPDNKGFYILYKGVGKDLESKYNTDFKYIVNRIFKEDANIDKLSSCSLGLHFTSFSRLENFLADEDIILSAKVHIDDIVTCLDNKIRCKKAKIIEIVQC